ncbi:hypothetical protein GCM10010252_05470 [Streptomyces aureoverticillatus]|nr:hypothetical protein GCM10010252_05470 [Streptomyces aureoverticillatus]
MDAVARRPVAWTGAVVLWAEAVGIALLNWFLGLVVDKQDMSMGGLDPHAMSIGAWIAGGLFGLYLALCGLTLARTGARDRAPGRFGKILLISAAVVHALLGAFAVGLVGWTAFFFMMVVLGLIVLTLMAYDKQESEDAGAAGGAVRGVSTSPTTP